MNHERHVAQGHSAPQLATPIDMNCGCIVSALKFYLISNQHDQWRKNKDEEKYEKTQLNIKLR